jgi:hypothetical protein
VQAAKHHAGMLAYSPVLPIGAEDAREDGPRPVPHDAVSSLRYSGLPLAARARVPKARPCSPSGTPMLSYLVGYSRQKATTLPLLSWPLSWWGTRT